MIKSELIAKLAAENPHLSRDEAERVVAAVLDGVAEALAAGRRVELRGFGAFSVRARPARAGRNPRTGEPVAVRGKAAPFFKSGKEMRERLNVTDDGAPAAEPARAGRARQPSPPPEPVPSSPPPR